MTSTTTEVANEAAIDKLVERYKQWVFGPDAGRTLTSQDAFREGSAHNVCLYNRRLHRYLQWEKQTWGINLGWTDDESPATAKRVSRWFFTRKDGKDGPVTYGETVALGNGKDPSYLKYESRTWGINLAWKSNPAFEWRILGGVAGKPVKTGDRVAIHNAKAGSSSVPGVLIFFDRTVGGDIGWPDSKTWLEQGSEKIFGMAKDAVTKLVMEKLGGRTP